MKPDYEWHKEIKRMKKAENRRILAIILISAALTIAAVVSGTFAWRAHTLSADNALTGSVVDIAIDAGSGDGSGETLQFTNEGKHPVFLRVSYAESWESEEEWIMDHTSADIGWSSAWETDWEKKEDGWYYYKKILAAGETSESVLAAVNYEDDILGGRKYELSFLAEGVQASDEDAVNTDATQTVFGRAGSIDADKSVGSDGKVSAGTVEWE